MIIYKDLEDCIIVMGLSRMESSSKANFVGSASAIVRRIINLSLENITKKMTLSKRVSVSLRNKSVKSEKSFT